MSLTARGTLKIRIWPLLPFLLYPATRPRINVGGSGSLGTFYIKLLRTTFLAQTPVQSCLICPTPPSFTLSQLHRPVAGPQIQCMLTPPRAFAARTGESPLSMCVSSLCSTAHFPIGSQVPLSWSRATCVPPGIRWGSLVSKCTRHGLV